MFCCRNDIYLLSYKEVHLLAEQNITILGHLGGVPEYKHHPPKEELVDTVSFFALRP